VWWKGGWKVEGVIGRIRKAAIQHIGYT